jgi:hypothetical protein
MIGVCLYWDNDFVKGIGAKRYYSYVKQTAKAFGATHLFWIGITKESLVIDQEIVTEVYDNTRDIMKKYPSVAHIFVDPAGDPDLKKMPVNKQAIFYFGPDGEKLPIDKKADFVLRVESKIELYAHVTMGIVLHGFNNHR